MADMDNAALGWDDEIKGTGSEFEPVDPGEYAFRVVSMERERYAGGDKMGPCPVARIEIELTDAPRPAHIFERLYLNKKVMWKIVSFFTSIGLHEKGDEAPFKPDWTRVAGRTGRVSVGVREYNGKRYNEVKRWIPAEGGPAPAQAAPQAPAPRPQAVPAPPALQAQIDQTFKPGSF